MIAGIDGNEANTAQPVGANEYAFQIIKNLQKLSEDPKNDLKLIVYLKKKPLPHLPEETQNFKYKIIYGGANWILTRLMPDLFFGEPRPDVFFTPGHYTPPFAPMPRVCAIMDIGYLKFSSQFEKFDFWQLSLWSAISIFVSKAIIAISNSTKNDIVRHYPFAGSKSYVTLLAYDKERLNTSIPESLVRRIKNRYSIVDDYILYLGTLKPSKNVEGLITAFQAVISNDQFPRSADRLPISNLKLVIAGKKGWLDESIYETVERLGLKDRIIFTDYIAEDDKPALIKGAKAFVLPSFWEGFGLDALNAMACGVPVIASKAGSLPEVVGEAGILIDPESSESIAKAINKVLLAGHSQYNSMVSAGLAQAKRFSWEKCARETLKVLEHVSGQNRQKIIK